MRLFLTSPLFLAVFILIIAIVNGVALMYLWYFRFSWLDKFLHFAGGFWVAAASYRFVFKRFKVAAPKACLAVMIVAVVALLGVFWEFFEFGTAVLLGNANSVWLQLNGLSDTLNDLLFDLLGGLLAVVPIVWFRN